MFLCDSRISTSDLFWPCFLTIRLNFLLVSAAGPDMNRTVSEWSLALKPLHHLLSLARSEGSPHSISFDLVLALCELDLSYHIFLFHWERNKNWCNSDSSSSFILTSFFHFVYLLKTLFPLFEHKGKHNMALNSGGKVVAWLTLSPDRFDTGLRSLCGEFACSPHVQNPWDLKWIQTDAISTLLPEVDSGLKGV